MLLFASPDFGAAGAAGFVLILCTLPFTVAMTISVLCVFCFFKNSKSNEQGKYIAFIVSSAVAVVVTVIAGCAGRLRDDSYYFLIAPTIGTPLAIVVGFLLLADPPRWR
jgi:hypothetical protein